MLEGGVLASGVDGVSEAGVLAGGMCGPKTTAHELLITEDVAATAAVTTPYSTSAGRHLHATQF